MKQRALKTAFALKRAEVQASESQADKKVARILAIPEIKEARAKYISAMFESTLGENNANEAKAKADYIAALKKHGFTENDFKHAPLCPVCGDEGFVDGKLCSCVWSKYVTALKAVCEIESRAPHTFNDANFSVAKDEAQRDTLKKLYDFGKAWAQKLPSVKTKTLTFFGTAGTGKTFLSSAIAREAVENGKSVKYVSAYEFNSAMLAVHTSLLDERDFKLHDYLTADLLVIDDLGTEPLLKNVSLEYLLLVLEERTNKGLTTLITTNLSPARLIRRYGERIYSRLASKQFSRIFEFGGNDLRIN